MKNLAPINSLKNSLPFLVVDVPTKPLSKAEFFIRDNENLHTIEGIKDLNELELKELLNGENQETKYYSTVYCGHQFGHFVPRLGDGRVHFLGEFKTFAGDAIELQLKGLGRTPFSRMGDGRAVFRSSLREYLASHAMEALGIPTTKAFALIDSDEVIYREEKERGAIALRAAASFLRFGHFEYLASLNRVPELEKLIDFTIENYFPEYFSHPNAYNLFFQDVVKRTAKLMAHWLSVGFCHGVMNTDNMSILGLTLDYGPYGFMEKFDYHHVCNHSDHEGRYAYGNQPIIGFWNLERLADALSLIMSREDLDRTLKTYQEIFNIEFMRLMRRKLGLQKSLKDDDVIIGSVISLLDETKVDMTLFFRNLNNKEKLLSLFLFEKDKSACFDFLAKLETRWGSEDVSAEERFFFMQQANPKFILRNYLAQKIIDLYNEGQREEAIAQTQRLLKVLKDPFNEHFEDEDLASECPPEYLHLEVSCSS